MITLFQWKEEGFSRFSFPFPTNELILLTLLKMKGEAEPCFITPKRRWLTMTPVSLERAAVDGKNPVQVGG